jgi:hypothetical protein
VQNLSSEPGKNILKELIRRIIYYIDSPPSGILTNSFTAADEVPLQAQFCRTSLLNKGRGVFITNMMVEKY